MLNQKSQYLVIVIATANRLEQLKNTLEAIKQTVQCDHEVIVIDGNSSDGTVDFLKGNPDVTPVFQKELVGASRSYNDVWKKIDCRYTCWLSDDTLLVKGGMDTAVSILEKHPDIGMVGLKMKDIKGPWTHHPYMGNVTDLGVLTCNHGVMPMRLLARVGYFNEDYKSYLIDPDLTASILSTGKRVVMTKKISVLHERRVCKTDSKYKKMKKEIYENTMIYEQKFQFLKTAISERAMKRKKWIDRIYLAYMSRARVNGLLASLLKYLKNTLGSGFISVLDSLFCLGRKYHLVQKIPDKILGNVHNPYAKEYLEGKSR